jgi:hypothetical protein
VVGNEKHRVVCKKHKKIEKVTSSRDDKVEISASIHVVADGWIDRKCSGNLISVRSRPS